jgi:hypothetical protein
MGVELGGWSAGGMTTERGVALLAVEELIGETREGEVGKGVGAPGLDRRRAVRVTEDAVDVVELAARVAVRETDGENERRNEKRNAEDPSSTRHAGSSHIAPRCLRQVRRARKSFVALASLLAVN